MILFALAGCVDTLLDPEWEGGVFLEVEGPVEGAVDSPGEALRAATVWAWVVDDRVDAAVLEVDFVPELGTYRAQVGHPPAPDPGRVDAPQDLRLLGDATLMVGALVIVSGPATGPLDLEAEPVPTLRALVAPDLVEASLYSDSFAPVAGWSTHRLGLLGSPSSARLDALPGWTGEPCAVGAFGPGLTVYGPGAGCALEPLAEPGTTARIEGVPLEPLLDGP